MFILVKTATGLRLCILWATSPAACVCQAIEVGYRSIGTAQAYFNEARVGEAIAGCDEARDCIFLTTKVWIHKWGVP
ncbi:MAG TPA: hypothetical protein DC009_00990 [Porphyromonadaceae bacterium]|nr:hypothetical protein [Porphyromonadaceae bacterium]